MVGAGYRWQVVPYGKPRLFAGERTFSFCLPHRGAMHAGGMRLSPTESKMRDRGCVSIRTFLPPSLREVGMRKHPRRESCYKLCILSLILLSIIIHTPAKFLSTSRFENLNTSKLYLFNTFVLSSSYACPSSV